MQNLNVLHHISKGTGVELDGLSNELVRSNMTEQRDVIGFHLPQLGLSGDLSELSCHFPREGTQEEKG